MNIHSVNIGTTSTYKDDHNVNVRYRQDGDKFIIEESTSQFGSEINTQVGRSFDTLEDLVAFSKQFLKNILD